MLRKLRPIPRRGHIRARVVQPKELRDALLGIMQVL